MPLCCWSQAEGADEEAKALQEVKQWLEKYIVESEHDSLTLLTRYYLSFPSLPETNIDKPRRKETKNLAAQRLGLAKYYLQLNATLL